MEARTLNYSRRMILANASKATILASAGTLISQVACPSTLLAQEVGDYRAIVCIYLRGGYDNWSGVPPFDEYNHSQYAAARANIALSRNQLGSTVLQPTNDLGGYMFALNPQLAPLIEIFNLGDLAVIQNVGALVEPTSKARYEGGGGSPSTPTVQSQRSNELRFVKSNRGWRYRMGWKNRGCIVAFE